MRKISLPNLSAACRWLTFVSLLTPVFALLIFTTKSLGAAQTTNKLASNKLASNKLASNKLASNKLASKALSSTRLEANMATADLLATADGRDVYAYLIRSWLEVHGQGIAAETLQDFDPGITNVYLERDDSNSRKLRAEVSKKIQAGTACAGSVSGKDQDSETE